MLSAEPDDTIVVQTVAWLPGRGVAPHDHQTWGVVVGIEGAERNVNWRRLDDGARPDYAEIEVAEDLTVGNGDVVTLLPDDIHSVRNESEATSLSLHLYGRALSKTERFEFDPITNVRRICPQRKRR
ncbi:MAG: cysteine dioxygenase family protein [Rhodospirillaceae bacterium]